MQAKGSDMNVRAPTHLEVDARVVELDLAKVSGCAGRQSRERGVR
jgi:hypothetical protein